MSELNINNLPAEILTEVFGNLNERNLNNATIVCQLWNKLIESAFQWSLTLAYDKLDKFWSKNPDDAEQKMNFILTTNRKFGKIEIVGSRMLQDDRIVEIFKRHGSNVVELRLYSRRISNPSLTRIAELLTFTPNLEHVVVDIYVGKDIKISHGSSDVLLEQFSSDLKKLEGLEFRGDDYRIIKCFRKAKLTTIEICKNVPSEHRSLLVDFLSTQDKLTKLTVDSYSPSILVEMGKVNVPIPFRLTQLSISSRNYQEKSQEYDHLVRFIKSQAGSLTEMEMNCEILSSVHECVFADMSKLTILWVEINGLPRDNGFYDRLKENSNVQTLRLLDNSVTYHLKFVGKFLQKFPNIRMLILMCVEYNTLLMAKSLSKLESLYIEEIHGSSLNWVELPNLKTLHVQYLCCKINWNQFTKAHPLLAELTIVRMASYSYLTSDDIDQITTNVDLQHITIGAGFVADNRFFEIVGSKCKNLKVLDLDRSCISQNLRHYTKVDVLRLRDSITCPNVFRSSFLS